MLALPALYDIHTTIKTEASYDLILIETSSGMKKKQSAILTRLSFHRKSAHGKKTIFYSVLAVPVLYDIYTAIKTEASYDLIWPKHHRE
ncbi:hypothetical protein [Xenorhabdus sp. PB62.4]|uniref:hypothetical protein n=1 Tax=Xenorhabdus sp. PB62.4 TaxID=1851573 RepID=UPI001656E398|nr:hypothetical protein [Xenorhabdus sp. PB62.4]